MGECLLAPAYSSHQDFVYCLDIRNDGGNMLLLRNSSTAHGYEPQVPAGIFLPTIAIGACLGRAVGLLT